MVTKINATRTLLFIVLAMMGLGFHYSEAQTTNIEGIEFKIRSATLAGGGPNLRFILSATNKNKGPVGIFLCTGETSFALDSGLSYQGSSIVNSSGIGKCLSGESHDTCERRKETLVTTIPGGVSDNIILEFQGPSSDEARRQGHNAALADFTGVMYITNGDGESGFIPLSFSDVSLRNTLK
jgi:hypothetical protein